MATRNASEETQQLTAKHPGPSDLEIQIMVMKEVGEMQTDVIHQAEFLDLIYAGVFLIWTVLFGMWAFDKNAACGEGSLHTFALVAFWTTLTLTLLYAIISIVTFSAEKNLEVVITTATTLGCIAFVGILMLVIWGFIILFTMTKEAGCEGLYYLTFIYPIFLVCFVVLMSIIGWSLSASSTSKHLGKFMKL